MTKISQPGISRLENGRYTPSSPLVVVLAKALKISTDELLGMDERRAAVMNGYDIPLGVYFDNGSEFLTHDIAGRGHRKKANWNKGDDPPTILSLLGVTMTNALVKNAKAKNIFYTFKEFVSKAFSGYSGGTIAERPEDHAKKVKAGNIPTDKEIAELLGY